MKIEKTDPVFRMKTNKQLIWFIIVVPLVFSLYMSLIEYRDLVALFAFLSVTTPLSIFFLLCLIKKAVLTKHFLVVKNLFSKKRIAYKNISEIKNQMDTNGSLASYEKQIRIYDANGIFTSMLPKKPEEFYDELKKRVNEVKENR